MGRGVFFRVHHRKIFCNLFAVCIPIYRGADNVAEKIPNACFIDLRDFSSLEALYAYLKSMDEQTFNEYYDAIEDFLGSKEFYPFSLDYFAKTLLDEIAGE